MTAKQMEDRLLRLSEEFKRSRDSDVRREYQDLHARWMTAKETS